MLKLQGAKNTQAMKEHFNYITRNDELPLYDESGELINLKEAVNEVNKIIDDLEAKSYVLTLVELIK